jgi:hypothetical protein
MNRGFGCFDGGVAIFLQYINERSHLRDMIEEEMIRAELME